MVKGTVSDGRKLKIGSWTVPVLEIVRFLLTVVPNRTLPKLTLELENVAGVDRLLCP